MKISKIKLKIKEEWIKTKSFAKKTLIATIISLRQVIIPSIVIMEALKLLGYAANSSTLISSAAIYFIIEEIKSYIMTAIKEVKK